MLVMYTSPGRLGSILISCFASPSLVLVAKRSRSVSLYISTNEASIWYCMGRRNTLSQWLPPSLICLSACLFLSIGKHVLGHLQSVQLTSAATWDFLAISCPGFFFIIWSTTSYKKLGEGSFILKLSFPFILWEENISATTTYNLRTSSLSTNSLPIPSPWGWMRSGIPAVQPEESSPYLPRPFPLAPPSCRSYQTQSVTESQLNSN